MAKPLMAKATAVWLVDNTTISFKQIADFVGMHELEVQGIADGDVATGVKGFDPIANNQLTQEEIDAAQKQSAAQAETQVQPGRLGRGKAPRPAVHAAVETAGPSEFDPVAGQVPPRTQRRSDRQAGGHHQAHHPIDPRADALEHRQHAADRSGALGLCKQSELDTIVQKAAAKKAAEGGVMSDDERPQAGIHRTVAGNGQRGPKSRPPSKGWKPSRCPTTPRTRKTSRLSMRTASLTCPKAAVRKKTKTICNPDPLPTPVRNIAGVLAIGKSYAERPVRGFWTASCRFDLCVCQDLGAGHSGRSGDDRAGVQPVSARR